MKKKKGIFRRLMFVSVWNSDMFGQRSLWLHKTCFWLLEQANLSSASRSFPQILTRCQRSNELI